MKPRDPCDPVRFNHRGWAKLEQAAARLDALSDRAGNTRRWTPGFNLVGLAGEACFARAAGIPFVAKAALGDGGEDFPGIDVKATSSTAPTLHLTAPAGEPLRAAHYALVHVDVAARSAAYLGYATAAMLEQAPRRDLGNGPTRALPAPRLRRALPPPYLSGPSFYEPTSAADLALVDAIAECLRGGR